MFTGLVEELGTVRKMNKSANALSLAIEAVFITDDVKIGDSIAVNGVCLTVTAIKGKQFTVDVMPTTFFDTTLRLLKEGMNVNLERAMLANGRFGGHFVSGHVDCTGKITKKEKVENSVVLEITLPKEFLHLTMDKGSITIDGTSLTIFKTTNHSITVSLIPHTAAVSIVGHKKVGDFVNIECDLLAKQIHSFMKNSLGEKENKLTSAFLHENGFC